MYPWIDVTDDEIESPLILPKSKRFSRKNASIWEYLRDEEFDPRTMTGGSSLRVACAPPDTCSTRSLTAKFHLYSSAHLNLSLSLQTAICRETAFQCFTSGLHPSFQHSMSALWKTYSSGLPCYLGGNRTNTIPHSPRHEIPHGTASDSRHDSWTGSRLFEVNIWMWRYGRALPRKISVADAEEMRMKPVKESRRKGGETLNRRSLTAGALPGHCARQNKSCVSIASHSCQAARMQRPRVVTATLVFRGYDPFLHVQSVESHVQ